MLLNIGLAAGDLFVLFITDVSELCFYYFMKPHRGHFREFLTLILQNLKRWTDTILKALKVRKYFGLSFELANNRFSG